MGVGIKPARRAMIPNFSTGIVFLPYTLILLSLCSLSPRPEWLSAILLTSYHKLCTYVHNYEITFIINTPMKLNHTLHCMYAYIKL